MVHCSAGIGRTGTVLFDLLCYDNLNYHRKVDIFEVLCQMRNGRARLVENRQQFNLCLKLLDELVFGFTTIVTAPELPQKLPELLAGSSDLYEHLAALPSNLDYSDAIREQNSQFNRSSSVLPSNTHSVFIAVSELLYLD